MSMETIERLVKVHTELLTSLAPFRGGNNDLHYNFNDSSKAVSAIAKLIEKASGSEATDSKLPF